MASRFPMPQNPNGWFQVGLSRDVSAGEVKSIHYFGKDLVLFRTQEGEAKVFDAVCPHLGAHLGLGRVVDGDLECLMHRWRFAASDGHTTHIPHAQRIPARAAVPCWPVSERNGVIFVWHHAEGAAPEWEIPEIAGVLTDAWTPWRVSHYQIKTHCQEIGENVLDAMHLLGVHGMVPPENSSSNVEVHGHELHVFQHMRMGEGVMADIEVPVKTRTVGPGVAILSVEVGPVETVAFVNQTPVDEDLIDAWIVFSLKRQGDPETDDTIAEMYQSYLTMQYEQDIPVWDTKRFIHRPLLSDADGPIPVWRKWYRQFYSKDWWTALDSDPQLKMAG